MEDDGTGGDDDGGDDGTGGDDDGGPAAIDCVVSEGVTQTATTVTGTSGNDTIDCTNASGGKTITGGDGNDTITGTVFDDNIVGGEGNDTLTGGPGEDTIDGGPGENTITLSDQAPNPSPVSARAMALAPADNGRGSAGHPGRW